MANIDDVIITLTNEEHIRNKTMYAGTSDIISANLILCDSNYQLTFNSGASYSPALFKIIDELLVNAYDHFINCIIKQTIQHKLKSKQPDRYVQNINVAIDQVGKISIFNNGYGIPIVAHKSGLYLPQVLFTDTNTGTNMSSDKNRITGGTNGVGAKIATAFSNELEINTADEKFIYKQQMSRSNTSCKAEFNEPAITPNNKPNIQGTKITFLIDWASTQYKAFNAEIKRLFIGYILKRLVQIKMATWHMAKITNCPVPEIKFSNCGKPHIINAAAAFTYDHKYTMTIKAENAAYPSDSLILIYITFANNKYQEMSVINGIEVTENPFLAHIKKEILADIVSHCYSKRLNVSPQQIKKYFTLVMVGSIANPSWVGQTKEGLKVEKSVFTKYNIKASLDGIRKQICDLMFEFIASAIMNKKTKLQKPELKKYFSCENLIGSKKKTGGNYLFLSEGDSASSFIGELLKVGQVFTPANSGRLTLAGVVFNTYHKINRIDTSDFKYFRSDKCQTKLTFSQKAEDNAFIKEFRYVTQLSDTETYEDAATLAKLPYSNIICATDPDLDGYNICGLLTVLISKWPGLIKHQRFQILHLPICRIIPEDINKNKAKYDNGKFQYWEFFTQKELSDWLNQNKIPNGYTVKYYKGLATVDKAFYKIIACNIHKYLYTVFYDNDADAKLELYYGKYRLYTDSDGKTAKLNLADERKKILRTPIRPMTTTELKFYLHAEVKALSITTLLEIFVKSYQIDNVNRKLLKLMDGQNNVTGKLLHSFMTIFGAKNKELLVSNIAAKAKEQTNYHHGEKSIEDAVIGCGQTFPGKRLMPLLIDCGGWGSRDDGGKKTCGAPRYINAVLNEKLVRAIFRKEDEIILPQQQEEGRFIEPYFYLPILPIIALDNYVTTGHGWKIEIWGRDFNAVAQLILEMLNQAEQPDYEIKNKILPISAKLNTGSIDYYNYEADISDSKLFAYSTGIYKHLANFNGSEVIHITELPVGKWTNNYVESLNDKVGDKNKPGPLFNVVDAVIKSDGLSVDIKVVLKPDWRANLKVDRDNIKNADGYDDITLAFGLRARINDELNIVMPKIILGPGNIYKNKVLDKALVISAGGIKSYATFYDMIVDWFKFRYFYYERRIVRQKLILAVKIAKLENIIRYIDLYTKLNLSGATSAEFDRILLQNNFSAFAEFNHVGVADADIIAANISEANISKAATTTPGFSYAYLGNIKTKNMSAEYKAKNAAKLSDLLRRLAKLNEDNVVINTWRQELSEINLN
jgi:DNA topoisomerase-2